MAWYHVSPKDGQPKPCKGPQRCAFRNDANPPKHFESMSDAIMESHKIAKGVYGTVPGGIRRDSGRPANGRDALRAAFAKTDRKLPFRPKKVAGRDVLFAQGRGEKRYTIYRQADDKFVVYYHDKWGIQIKNPTTHGSQQAAIDWVSMLDRNY